MLPDPRKIGKKHIKSTKKKQIIEVPNSTMYNISIYFITINISLVVILPY